jgi:hypothetical protein
MNGCCGIIHCGREETEEIPAIDAISTREAADFGLDELARVFAKPYGQTVDFLGERAAALVGLGASRQAVDRFVAAVMEKGKWELGNDVAKKAGRELTQDEKDAAFRRLGLSDFLKMAEAVGKPSEDVLLIVASAKNAIEAADWRFFEKIVALNPTHLIVATALRTCLARNNHISGLAIAKAHGCPEDVKKLLAKVVFKEGSIDQAKAAVRDLFGRDLSPEEIVLTAQAAARLAEERRKWIEEDANTED